MDAVLAELPEGVRGMPHALLVAEARREIGRCRQLLAEGEAIDAGDIPGAVARALAQIAAPSLRHVINATGVVLHTNLGRAPLGKVQIAGGYTNLEYDLETGRRGKRDAHLAGLVEHLLGVPGIAVNNNAAAVYLVLKELAAGEEVIVSRGELIEIGDGFRIPDIMRSAGVELREVGTTNRTRIEDYRAAITARTRLLLRVHPSNFHIEGFTAKPKLEELTALGRECGVPVYEDLGSGCLVDLRAWGVNEPLVRDSIAAGVNIVSFSGDKLLGASQAGIIAGDGDLVERVRRNPMFRAMRIDKLATAVLEEKLRAILMEDYEAVPALRMIRLRAEEIRERAERFVERAGRADWRIVEGRSVIGGGATPQQWLPGWLVAIGCGSAAAVERRLRLGEPPVVVRIEDDTVLVDLRTVMIDEEEALIGALLGALIGAAASGPGLGVAPHF